MSDKPTTETEFSTSEKRRKDAEEQKLFSTIPDKCKQELEDATKNGVLTKLTKFEPNFVSNVVINTFEEMYGVPPLSERLSAYLKDAKETKGTELSNLTMVSFDDESDDEMPFYQSVNGKRYLKEKEAEVNARINDEEKWLPNLCEQLNEDNLTIAENEFKKELAAFKAASAKTRQVEE